MNRLFQTSISVLLVLVLAFGVVSTAAFAADTDEAETAAQTIYVTTSQINSSGFYRAVQNALNEAESSATASNIYTVFVETGSYDLTSTLHVYSNTTLDLRGVTLKRSGSCANMIRVGDTNSATTGGTGYTAYKNVKIWGGTLDGNNGDNTMINAFHATNVTLDSITLKNEKNGHMIEVAGVDGFNVKNCTFKDQTLAVGKYGYEAIQLDVLHPFHVAGFRYEDLCMKNVVIEGCTFDNIPRGIGTHTAVHNNPHTNITIRNNTFKNITSIAISGAAWANATITGNTINGAPRGISVFSEPGACTYLSSVIAKKGSTTAHYKDTYQTPSKANIVIAYNVLKNVGTTDDKYVYAESTNGAEAQGIAVIGDKLTSTSRQISDESGKLPAGDYYIDGVNIHDNYIDVRGHGVRVEHARNVKVNSNVIVCTKNTAHAYRKSDGGKVNYYGIALREDARATDVSNNSVMNAEVNGIQMVVSSADNISYNTISKPGDRGIALFGSSSSTITNNDIISPGDTGIYLTTNDYTKSISSSNPAAKVTSITNNRIRNTSDYAVYVRDGSTLGTLKSNTFVSCSKGVRNTGTTGSNYSSSSSLTGFTLTGVGVKMGVGTSYKIVPHVSPVNAFATFSYSSTASSVASVDSYGRISALKAGTATIKVTSNGITKSYSVEVNTGSSVSTVSAQSLATPQISGFASVDTGVKISWNAVSGAAKYRVYYKGSNGWTKMGDTTSTSFIDTDVKSGSTYTYTLRCINDDGTAFTSSYNSSGWKYTYNMATPQITNMTSSSSGVKITWGKVANATKYRVYYKGSKGWTKMADVTGTSYTDSDVSWGTTYTYTVRCINSAATRFTSSYSSSGWKHKHYLDTPSISGFSSASNGVKITWKAVSGAAKYRIYYKGSSGWVKLGESSTASYTHTGAKVGTAYKYTVRCINSALTKFTSDYNSTGWSYTYIPYIATPKISKCETVSNGVKVTWGAVSGASLYRLYYKSSSGWTKIGDTKSTSYVHTGGTYGTTYTYTVRCLTSDGKNFNSSYDSTGTSHAYAETPDVWYIYDSGDKVSVNWSFCTGAAKYYVYRKNNGSWTRIAETTNNGYVDTDVQHGLTYTYTIRAVGSDGSFASYYNTAGWSCSVTALPVETRKLTYMELYGDQLWFEFDSEGVSNYTELFVKEGSSWRSLGQKYTGGSGKHLLEGTGLTVGNTYTFTFRAVDYRGTALSSFDPTGVTLRLLKKVENVDDVNTDSRHVKVTWDPVPGASYYELSVDQTGEKFKVYGTSYTFDFTSYPADFYLWYVIVRPVDSKGISHGDYGSTYISINTGY